MSLRYSTAVRLGSGRWATFSGTREDCERWLMAWAIKMHDQGGTAQYLEPWEEPL